MQYGLSLTDQIILSSKCKQSGAGAVSADLQCNRSHLTEKKLPTSDQKKIKQSKFVIPIGLPSNSRKTLKGNHRNFAVCLRIKSYQFRGNYHGFTYFFH